MDYQVARMIYQFNKLPLIRTGKYQVEQGGNLEFELFSFFEVCFHLKDWIEQDPELGKSTNVAAYVKATPVLRVCADICNTAKHRTLTRKTNSTAPLGPFRIDRVVTVGPDGSSVRIEEAKRRTELGDTCCFKLARDCLTAWGQFFQDNGIQSPLLPFLDRLIAEGR